MSFGHFFIWQHYYNLKVFWHVTIMNSEDNKAFICLYEDNIDVEAFPHKLKQLWEGNWTCILDEVLKNVITSPTLCISQLNNCLKDKNHEETVAIGIACLSAFCEINCTGPCDKLNFNNEYFGNNDVFTLLVSDGEEIYSTIECPELLWIALETFNTLPNDNMIVTWWKLRCYFAHQKILDELSPSLLSKLEDLISKLKVFEEEECDMRMKIFMNIDINQVYVYYGKIQESKDCLDKIQEYSGFVLDLKGALGMRTKYQQKAVAQLILNITKMKDSLKIPALETHSKSNLPIPMKLCDDVRLENIKYLDIDDNSTELTSIEQLICLNTIQYLHISQPKDEILNEELLPYINLLLDQKHGPWAVRVNALLLKCRLESKNKRTVERSMMQCEEVVKSFDSQHPSVINRLSYVWGSGLPLKIHSSAQLADLLISIGLIKAALDIYLKLQLWEDVIACYTILELRHKAAEIIIQELSKKPTVKLYCLLGDATDDVSMYKKAWEFSKEKSGRAQRHWGNYLFSHKKYEECIPHYVKSCEINSLQDSVWLRLGFAALTVENWELSATAYRRYTYLEPHLFEAWNNLAKVYVKQGNKQRAYKALSESLKFNYDNWQVWENMALVSLDTGHFDDVIRSYHRLLDLQKKYVDLEILTLLVKAVVRNISDADGNGAKRLQSKLLELFGRITSTHNNDAKIWELYADVSPDDLLKAQRLTKSCNMTIQNSKWTEGENITEMFTAMDRVGDYCLKIAEDSSIAKGQVVDVLSSARLLFQAVIRVIAKENITSYNEKISNFNTILERITADLRTFL